MRAPRLAALQTNQFRPRDYPAPRPDGQTVRPHEATPAPVRRTVHRKPTYLCTALTTHTAKRFVHRTLGRISQTDRTRFDVQAPGLAQTTLYMSARQCLEE